MTKILTKNQLENITENEIENFRYLKGQFQNIKLEESKTMSIKIITENGSTNWIFLSTKNYKDFFKVLLEAKNSIEEVTK